jgi:hypothetical protein
VERRILNLPQVLPRGVRVECVYGTSSLILMPVAFFPIAFLTLAGGAWVEATLRLSARHLEEPTLGLLDAAPAESELGV